MTYLTGDEKPSLEELAHHGTKGMKWGVRRTDGGSISPNVQRHMEKAETKFQNKRSAANSKVAQNRASGVIKPKDQAKASKFNSQNRKNQESLKAQGLEVYKKTSEATKNTKSSDLKKNNASTMTRGEKTAVYLLAGPLLGHYIIKKQEAKG